MVLYETTCATPSKQARACRLYKFFTHTNAHYFHERRHDPQRQIRKLGRTVSLARGSSPARRRSALSAISTGSSRDSRTAVAQRSCVDGVCPLLPKPLPSRPRVSALIACRRTVTLITVFIT